MIKIVSINNYLSKDGINSFDCGDEKLNAYLKKYAHQNEMRGLSRTFFLIENLKLIGFYTLSSASLGASFLPSIIKEKLPNYPIPCIRIGRLAIDKRYQNKGYGKMLMKDIILKTLTIANIAGVYALIVEPKESASGFYLKYGFCKVPESSTYILYVSTIKKLMNN